MGHNIGTSFGYLIIDTDIGVCTVEHCDNDKYTSEDIKLLTNVLGFRWGSDESLCLWSNKCSLEDLFSDIEGSCTVDILRGMLTQEAGRVNILPWLFKLRLEMYLDSHYKGVLDGIGGVNTGACRFDTTVNFLADM